MSDPRRQVPRTDRVLADPDVTAAAQRLGRDRVKQVVIDVLARVRSGEVAPGATIEAVLAKLPRAPASPRRVLNATGVVLHTNLGRAPLSPAAVDALVESAGYVDVELDLATGARGRRGRGALNALARAVPGAEQVLVVNNGAGALVLATTGLAAGRELVVSRGELVEIGDGFRLPDLVESTGARLREVGTTNRVSAEDYRRAIGPDTAAVLKVHPSNFRIAGFTSSVGIAQLATLGVPVIADIGSGLLAPDPRLPDEPDAATALRDGAAIVTCSGDKLLGGPQAGLLLGTAAVVEQLRRHPLARALRADKLTLAAFEASVSGPPTPTARFLATDPDALRRRCLALADRLDAVVVPSPGRVGGGSAPGLELPGWAVALTVDLAVPLRTGSPPVIGHVTGERLLLDLRCVEPADDELIESAVRRARTRFGAER